jgi:hypothetical protein
MRKIKTKYRLILLTASFFIIALGIFFFSKKNKIYVRSTNIYQSKLLSLPDTFTVNNKLKFFVEPSPNCILKLNTSWGTKVFVMSERVDISKDINAESGQHLLSVWCNNNKMESKIVIGKPEEASGVLESYIGSKSIPADNGKHWALLSVLPVDRYFNMVEDSSRIEFNEIRPNGSEIKLSSRTKTGIAFIKILSQKVKGKTLLTAQIDQAYGKEKELLELPYFPEKLSIVSESSILYADSRQFFKIYTKESFDKYQNRVADGTLIIFKVKDAKNNHSFYRSYTIDGIASVNIQNPKIPGTLEIVAVIENVTQSLPLSLKFKPYIADFYLRIDNKVQFLEIGPVIGSINQYAADGTEVDFVFLKSKSKGIAILKNGKTKVELLKNMPKDEKVSVTIGGLEKEISVYR